MITVINRINARLHSYYLKPGYKSRGVADAFSDANLHMSLQHEAYEFAMFLGRQYECKYIIDIGCGKGKKLHICKDEFEVIGVDCAENIKYCTDNYDYGQWLECNIDGCKHVKIPKDIVGRSVIICSEIIEGLTDPTALLSMLKNLLKDSPVAILTTPERDIARGGKDFGPPADATHVREWNLKELCSFVSSCGLNPIFAGLTSSDKNDSQKANSLLVFDGRLRFPKKVRDNFRVLAIMTCYNEADILEASIEYLISQKIDIYVIDNWSNDGSYEKAKKYLGFGVIHVERYPEQNNNYYEWEKLLLHVELLSTNLNEYDWIIHHDVDEFRESPFQYLNMREALYIVDYNGFNAIDHTIVEFPPIAGAQNDSSTSTINLRYFKFGTKSGYFCQIKGWKCGVSPLTLAATGGHKAFSNGLKLFPYKFLIKHLPVRSQEHGEKKIMHERLCRYTVDELSRGWHTQYNKIDKGHDFTVSIDRLNDIYDNFYGKYLVERLSGVSIMRWADSELYE